MSPVLVSRLPVNSVFIGFYQVFKLDNWAFFCHAFEAMTIISPYMTLFEVLSIAMVRRIAGFVSVQPLAL
ncbi:hypothetical protein [Methanosarcina sp.]|uniref:hypothetical protein n=1 Tax=Methanosarcina sp. TaxID=2213 RepID=UPI002AB82A28|nr:hypothetical protein [Methanosarcina sp.]MDY9925159.1 hypothetical protein [Methanosarcina sp.]